MITSAKGLIPIFHSWLWMIGISAILVGCHVPREVVKPSFEEAPPFRISGTEAIEEFWWTAFGDPSLDQQVQEALDGSLTLTAARERLRAAKALAHRESSALYPELDGTVETGYSKSDNTDAAEDYELGLAVGYEADLWGRIDSLVEAEQLRGRAEEEAYHAAALSLSAQVTIAWFEFVEALRQKDLLTQQLKNNQKIVKILEARFSSGQIGSADVLRQRQLIESTREQLYAVESRIGIQWHQLQLLKGKAPQESLIVTEAELPTLPPLPQTGLPSDLVQRRPDLRQAFYDLKALDADLAAAVANQYPRLNLTASISASAESPEKLFDTWMASVAGQIVAPLFDGGQRRAEMDRREALLRAGVANYMQATLEAFREVEDALLGETQQHRIVKSLERQLTLNEKTYKQLRGQYIHGASDYLSVLNNLIEGQRLQRDLLTARRELLEIRVALYRSLAGGIEPLKKLSEPSSDLSFKETSKQ
ncbi:efflux transporter outer membrane subunit [Candidatus Electrothrix sp.]|uniref:efflux transporter outer membrane subunit n=1 Tax=Candidatus Electrothrix sp. TaxID=2170559 RepID=UPI00405731AD